MDPVFKKLACKLDALPNGFPETESSVELRILAQLFSPEEAEAACRLEQKPQAAKEVGAELGWEERRTFTILKGMKKKGLIEIGKGEAGLEFRLIPFIVGFYENQNGNIDEKFALLVEEYYKEALHRIMSYKPSVHRVIPVGRSIPIGIEVMPYELASHYVNQAQSWGVLPCICRTQKRLIGEGCGHTVENCLAFSEHPGVFDKSERIRALSKEEALELLAVADREGLVHSANNVRDGVNYICNCCSCSCGVLRGMAEYGYLSAIGKSNFHVAIDADKCNSCGLCLDRCHFKSLRLKDGSCRSDEARCFGCGLCVSVCPSEALRLERKSGPELELPPETESDWMRERAKARGL